MADQEHKVIWRALLDIVNVKKNAKEAERELRQLEARERAVGEAFDDTDKKVNKSSESQTRSVGKISAALGKAADAYRSYGRNTEEYKNKLDALQKAQNDHAKAIQRAEQASLRKAAADTKLAAATERNQNAQNKLASSTKNLAAAQKAYDQIAKSSSSTTDQLTQASTRLSRAQDDVANAQHRAAQSANSMAMAQHEAAGSSSRAASANDSLAMSLERVRSRQIQVQKAGSTQFGGLRRQIQEVRTAWQNLGDIASKFNMILMMGLPAIIGLFGTLGGAVGALGAAFMALSSAIAPAIGILGTLPNLIAGIIVSAAALGTAFMGVGKALKAYSKMQQDAGKDAAAAAKQQETANKAVVTAQRRVQDSAAALADAQRNASKQSRDAARAVRDAYADAARSAEQASERVEMASRDVARAEDDLRFAQIDARAAQEDLNRAREEAVDQLWEMQKAVRNASFDEEEAVIALEEAQIRLAETLNSPFSSDLDRRKADLNYREAIARLADAREAKSEATKENAEAQAAGIEGTTVYANAQKRVVDTTNAVRDAQVRLADTQRELVKAQRDAQRSATESAERIALALERQQEVAADSARAIARAQRNYADSQSGLAEAYAAAKAAGEEGSTSAKAYEEALKALPPAAQAFVKYVVTLRDKLKELRTVAAAGLFPGLISGMKSLMTLFPMVKTTIGNTAKIFGDFFASLGATLATSEISGAIGRIFTSNEGALKNFLDGVSSLVVHFIKMGDAARPLTEWLSQSFATWAKGREQIPTEEMEKFFEKTRYALDILSSIFGNLWRGLKGVGRASEEMGRSLLGTIDDMTKKWADWTESVEGQNELRAYFRDVEPIVRELGGLFGDLMQGLVNLSTSDALLPIITTLREKVIPAFSHVFDVITDAGGAEGFAKLMEKVSEALVKMADSGALGGLTKAMELIGYMVDLFGRFVKIPGVGPLLSSVAAGLVLFKAMKFGASITGISSLYDGIKKLFSLKNTRSKAKALATDIATVSNATGTTSTGAVATGAKKQTAPKKTARVGKAVAGGAGAVGAVAMAASFLPLEGTLGKIVNWVAILGMTLPMLAGAFSKTGGAVKLLGGAFRFMLGPIGLIITAVAAIGAGLVWLYKNNETFRNFIDTAWQKIKDIIVGAWENFIQPAFNAISDFISDVLVPIFKFLWNNVIVPAFQGIGSFIAAAWNNVIKPVFSAVRDFIADVLVPIFKFLWNNVIVPAFQGIGSFISSAWNNVIKPVFKAIQGFIRDVLGPIFTWVWEKVIKPVWDALGRGIKWVWDNVITPVFSALKKGVDAVGKAFEAAAAFIGKVWDGIRNAISQPIIAVITWVNNNLIERINSLLSAIGVKNWAISKIPVPGQPSGSSAVYGSGKSASIMDRFASGGQVGGYSPHDRADNIPALLTAGEYVLPVRAVRKLQRQFGPSFLEHLRQGRAYASGGFVRAVNGMPSFPWGRYPSGGVHKALDIAVPVGTPVVSSLAGRVLRAGWDSTGFGNHIRMAFTNGTYMILGHLSRILAQEGQTRRAGEIVGLSGDSGRSTGPHVHAEMRTAPFDPTTSFNFTNAWNTGAIPTASGSGDNGLSWWQSMVLKLYDGLTNPIKGLANRTLPNFGVGGAFMLGGVNRFFGGARDWLIRLMGGRTEPVWSDLIQPPTEGGGDYGNRLSKASHLFNRGGKVPGYGNRDTVPAWLTPGEFVLNKGATEAIGAEGAQALNSGGFVRTRSGSLFVPQTARGYWTVRNLARAEDRIFGAGRDGAPGQSGEGQTINFNTVVNNPVREPASDSVQRRVSRTAQLGLIGGRRSGTEDYDH